MRVLVEYPGGEPWRARAVYADSGIAVQGVIAAVIRLTPEVATVTLERRGDAPIECECVSARAVAEWED